MLWRDDDLGTGFGDPVDEMIGLVSFVGDCRFGCDALDEVMGKGDVVALAGRCSADATVPISIQELSRQPDDKRGHSTSAKGSPAATV